jgi:hypothetical protein
MAQRQGATTLDPRNAKQVAAFEQELVRVFDIYARVNCLTLSRDQEESVAKGSEPLSKSRSFDSIDISSGSATEGKLPCQY